MAEFPALPFYTDAYLADTRHLTTEEHGAYLLLLLCAWRSRGCALKDDDHQLARMAGVSRARWRRLRPVLSEFFTVADGCWRQKKLTATYGAVAERVERNRSNGAKGGRATAARRAEAKEAAKDQADAEGCAAAAEPAEESAAEPANDNDEPIDIVRDANAVAYAADPATKTKAITKDQSSSGQQAFVATAAGLRKEGVDFTPLEGWFAAGADLDKDILPTITRIAARELGRTGKVPQSLAYYDAAVLEARDNRLVTIRAGRKHAADHPPTPEKRAFDRRKAEDWRILLGDAGNRFRGEYMSKNWRIPADHPVFLAAGLGMDPKEGPNLTIPREIYTDYGPGWGWRPRP